MLSNDMTTSPSVDQLALRLKRYQRKSENNGDKSRDEDAQSLHEARIGFYTR
jgi:hypothetical protein